MENKNTDTEPALPIDQTQTNNQVIAPPQLEPPVATAPPKPTRTGSKKLIVLIASLLTVALIATMLLIWRPWSNALLTGWHAPEAPKLSAQQIIELEKKYGYDVTYRPDVAPTEKFSFEVAYNFGACQNTTCTDAVAVYNNADLTKKVDSRTVAYKSQSAVTLTVSPPVRNSALDTSTIAADGTVDMPTGNTDAANLAIGADNRWGVAEMYYLVQRLDEQGAKLARPKVTIFTIKADQKILPATDVTAHVDTNGGVSFSWNAVDNAKDYYLIKVQRGKFDNYVAKYSVIARTSHTSLNFAEYNGDKSRADKAMSMQGKLSPDSSNYTQNSQLRYYDTKSEDSYYKEDGTNTLPGGKYSPADNGALATSFAVIAVNGDAYSPVRETDGNALLASAPVSTAFNQSIYMADQRKGSDVSSDSRLYTTQPITMADGHTAKKAVIYDASKASVDTSLPSSDGLNLPYVVQGTYIAGSETLYGAKGSFTKDVIQSKVAALNKRNIAAQPPTGVVDLSYMVKTDTDTLQLDSQTTKTDTRTSQNKTTVSPRSIPDVAYPVNGSTSLVKFIAANLMAGNYSMDIKNFYTDPTVGIWDAFWEAVFQNPYVGVNSAYMKNIQLNGTVLSVQYVGVTQEEMTNRQMSLLKQAQAIAPAITSADMSDRSKALAINKWLADNASYDNDALALLEQGRALNDYSAYFSNFPYAWNGLGTAVHNKGVCASYADAFKAFADQAGLKAITVIGTDNVSGGRHAWNKAFIDGKWQVVDATWDDNSEQGVYTRYFGMTDATANRVQDEEFMVDRFIGDYAAN